MEHSERISDHYDRWAGTYDAAPNATRDLNARVLRERLAAWNWSRVLEIGCGTGINTAWLLEHADEVVALDNAEGMLEIARRRVAGPKARFVVADVTQPWPVEPGFDLVVATLVLEHVRDLGPIFSEARRVLATGGTLYVAELHPFRQYMGSQARYREAEGGDEVPVPAFQHDIAEFVDAGLGNGFRLAGLGEWRGEGDSVPRLLTMRFE